MNLMNRYKIQLLVRQCVFPVNEVMAEVSEDSGKDVIDLSHRPRLRGISNFDSSLILRSIDECTAQVVYFVPPRVRQPLGCNSERRRRLTL